ncbi:MAG: peptide ABC transporter substrate-binding protein [Chloroflexi bacterium]|nr:peptide ABC transporter substrate-binding protein [Chloroflexota bacterium]
MYQRDDATRIPLRTRRLVSRRRFLGLIGLSGGSLLLQACTTAAPAAPTAAPTAAPAMPPASPSPALQTTTSPSPGIAPLPSPSASPVASPSPAVSASPAATSAVVAPPAVPGAPPATGTLRILSWQAPNQLNPYLSSGQADLLAARCCLEPLLTVDNSGRLEPVLAADVPSRENGGLPNSRTVVYRLKAGLTWADGQPLTADDVAFTYSFITNPETAATTTAAYRPLASVEALDALTVKLTFREATGGWYVPFVGSTGMVLPRHAFAGYAGAAARTAPYNLKPFGTGPYMVDSFAPGDRLTLVTNPRYRTPGRPAVGRVELKGGGDATTAARAVLQTGEFDYAWNLQVEGPVLQDILRSGRGEVVTSGGAGVELLLLNQADPGVEPDGERSSPATRHPFLTDPVVRKAMALAIDRQTLADVLYGNGLAGTVAATVLTTPTDLAWTGARATFDLPEANRLLDGAGYQRGSDSIRRTPGGARMAVLFSTSVNSLRQKEQAIIKDGWQKLGIDTELKAVDSGAFFGPASNPDAVIRFEADVQMLTVPFTSPFPAALMKRFYGKDPAKDWAQKSNSWAPANIVKWADPEYDRVYDDVLVETDPGRARALWQRLDELAVGSGVVVPLVDRLFVGARAPGLSGPAPRAFDVETWNIAEWTLTP